MHLENYQARVRNWMTQVFSRDDCINKKERAFRFLEESLELVQSLGLDQEDVLRTVQYVYGRPEGEVFQEVGGVMTTLAALCGAAGVNLSMAAQDELNRVNTPEIISKIKIKRATQAVPGDYDQ